MKKIFNIAGVAMLCMSVAMTTFTSCDDNDDFNTNQYIGGVNLNSFGPSPVARGGELRFLGSGMDQIVKISIPGCDDITDIERVSSEEIRVKVPQTAEPGYLTLHYAGGSIETKTMLTYSEPISIDEISPLTVKPGNELTISGEYLNLIKEVCFSFTTDSVNVYAEAFTAHDRKTISLIVPAEAISGTITLSDAKEMPNTIESEVEIEVIVPSVEAPLDLTNAKGGDKVTVKGKDFDLITSVEMPDGTTVEYTAEEGEEEAISFVLPDNTTDGAIVVCTASGVKVVVANIGMVVPTEITVVPADGILPGQEVTINGLNMDQVVSITLPHVDSAVEPTEVSATAVKFSFPAEAWSGEGALNLKSGKSVPVSFATAMPEVTGFEPAPVSAGADVTLRGRNLDLVTKIEFAGLEPVEISNATADAITVTVPATAATGALTLHKANGETATTPELEVNAPECAYVVSVDTEEPEAGKIMAFTLANGDKLTSVEVNGASVQYIFNADKLYVNLPASCGKGTVVRLVSSNGEISYTYDVIPATHVASVIYEGMFSLGNWDAGGLRLYKESFEGVPAGAKLVFYISATADAQIQLNDANWGQFAMIDIPAGATTVEYELTADNLSQILGTDDGWSTTAIVINGHTAVINKIGLEYERSTETVIWEGAWTCAGWNGNQDLAWGGYDWSTVKPGTVLRVYMTPTVADPASDWWVISLRSGTSWSNLAAPIPDQYGQPGSVLEVTLEASTIDELVRENGLIITGDGFIMNKITLE